MKDSKEKKLKNRIVPKDLTREQAEELMVGIGKEMVENLRRNTLKDGIDVPQKETPIHEC